MEFWNFTCAHLLIKPKGKATPEVLKQKVELNFQNGEVELSQVCSTLDHGHFAIAVYPAQPSACPLWLSLISH